MPLARLNPTAESVEVDGSDISRSTFDEAITGATPLLLQLQVKPLEQSVQLLKFQGQYSM